MEVKIPMKEAMKVIEKAYDIKNAQLMRTNFGYADSKPIDEPDYVLGTVKSVKYKSIAVTRHKRKRSVVISHKRAKPKRNIHVKTYRVIRDDGTKIDGWRHPVGTILTTTTTIAKPHIATGLLRPYKSTGD